MVFSNGHYLVFPTISAADGLLRIDSRDYPVKAVREASFANFGPRGGQSVSVMATLPPPSFFGNFQIYFATVFIRDIGGFGNQLFPTPEDPPTWATRIDLPTAAALLPDSQVVVRPSNAVTGIDGPVLLMDSLRSCELCGATST